jgi:anthranilate synthase component 2
MKVLIIDNFDSFTYNLYQFVGEILGTQLNTDFQLKVVRNNEVDLAQVKEFAADRIIISPGPGNPEDEAYFGVCAQVIKEIGPNTPLLGVCLGMQGIVHCFGGRVVKAALPMHGKLSPIAHSNTGVFANIPQDLEIMRYHSLIAEAESLPNCFEITAYISEGAVFKDTLPNGSELMGVKHRDFPIHGIQFHPESFASEAGKEMISNFLFS